MLLLPQKSVLMVLIINNKVKSIMYKNLKHIYLYMFVILLNLNEIELVIN